MIIMKMNKKVILISTAALFMGVFGCKEEKKNNAETERGQQEAVIMETSPIRLDKLTGSLAYSDAALMLDTPSAMKAAKAGEMNFDFNLANYELGAQTEGPNAQKLANSGKGQHIHFILDNQPYSAHYEAAFAKEIPEGVHHLVAFLSRSYHESVKNENSVVVRKLEVGDNPVDTIGLDMEAPTIIYSRPKGEYSGKDAESILLDFFVLNTSLSADGNKVRATINGEEFTINEWAPHVITGLPMGEVTIELELIDAQGNLVAGPFNKVKRKVTLKP